jgi:hypothetical protein
MPFLKLAKRVQVTSFLNQTLNVQACESGVVAQDKLQDQVGEAVAMLDDLSW